MASTMTSSSATSGCSRATMRQASRNMPSPRFSTFALCTAATRLPRVSASRKAARAMRSQARRVIRRSDTTTSGVTSISASPASMLRSA